jgi:preprotein translocase subunit SecF
MLDIVGKRNWYFAFSLLLIVPGVISLFLWGLRLSIDFTGGSRMTLLASQSVNEQQVQTVKSVFAGENIEVVTVQQSGKTLIIRTKPMTEKQDAAVLKKLAGKDKSLKQEGFETIGPVIGGETTHKAVNGLIIASVLIVFYIAWSFRNVRKPMSSWRFGICAIIALLHDALVVIGIFSLLGHFYGVELDSLFLTALLTVIGFSVHDTIVVFDRVRENLRRSIDTPFPQVVNNSILETFVRSLNTSLTAMLVLFTMMIFGGQTTFWFIAALLIGIASGTYSSIFNAAQLLVVWQEWSGRKRARA